MEQPLLRWGIATIDQIRNGSSGEIRPSTDDARDLLGVEAAGHIELAAPVIHPLVLQRFHSGPSFAAARLGISDDELHAILESRGVGELCAMIKRHPDAQDEWVLAAAPVVAPALRPAGSDLHELYQAVLDANESVRQLLLEGAEPHSQRFLTATAHLQDAICCLWSNQFPTVGPHSTLRHRRAERRRRSLLDQTQQTARTLLDRLCGFSVERSCCLPIVSHPALDVRHCGLSLEVMLKLFGPRFEAMIAKEMALGEILRQELPRCAVLLHRPAGSGPSPWLALTPTVTDGEAIQVSPVIKQLLQGESELDAVVAIPLLTRTACSEAINSMQPAQTHSPANDLPLWRPPRETAAACYHLTKILPLQPRQNVSRFSDVPQAICAYEHGAVLLHTPVEIRLPADDVYERKSCRLANRGEGRLLTTIGRVLFNEELPPDAPFMNETLDHQGLEDWIRELRERFGERRALAAFEKVQALALRHFTATGASLAMGEWSTPPNKAAILAEAEKQVIKNDRYYHRGIIANTERYHKVIDIWSAAKTQLRQTLVDKCSQASAPEDHLLHLLWASGSFNADEATQLSGMLGLVRCGSQRLQETPVVSSWGEGLTVAEYWMTVFSRRAAQVDRLRIQGDQKRLLSLLMRALRTMRIVSEDCGTDASIEMKIDAGFYNGQPDIGPLVGRICQETILAGSTAIVRQNEVITQSIAIALQRHGVPQVAVRSPAVCTAVEGVCQRCYGVAQGELVELETPVGLLAAHAISSQAGSIRWFGDPRYFIRDQEQTRSQVRGRVVFREVRTVINLAGRAIVVGSGGRLQIVDDADHVCEEHPLAYGAELHVADGDSVSVAQTLFDYDASQTPFFAEVSGIVQAVDLMEGLTVEVVEAGRRPRILPHQKPYRPAFQLTDEQGECIGCCRLPEGALLHVAHGEHVASGTLLAVLPRTVRDGYFGGVEAVEHLFRAQTPTHACAIAPFTGRVVELDRIANCYRLALETIDGNDLTELEFPRNQGLYCSEGDLLQAGDPLCHGPKNPHDVLEILGVRRCIAFLVDELEQHLRGGEGLQRRHLEVAIRAMLSHAQILRPGDTAWPHGATVRLAEIEAVNESLWDCVVVTEPGDSRFRSNDIVAKSVFAEASAAVKAANRIAPSCRPAIGAASQRLLRGLDQQDSPLGLSDLLRLIAASNGARMLEAAVSQQCFQLQTLAERAIADVEP